MVYLKSITDENGDLEDQQVFHFACMVTDSHTDPAGWSDYPETPHEWWGYESDVCEFCPACGERVYESDGDNCECVEDHAALYA